MRNNNSKGGGKGRSRTQGTTSRDGAKSKKASSFKPNADSKFKSKGGSTFKRKPKETGGSSYKPKVNRVEKPSKKVTNDESGETRLNKYIASTGLCSRREADVFIETGCVTINGKIVTELGSKVTVDDEVRFNGEPLENKNKVYILLNKPKDYLTTSADPQNRKTVFEIIKHATRERVFAVGRLDRMTTGVLLFTNDGDLTDKLTHPKYNKKKIYQVELDKPIKAADFKTIIGGFELEDGFIQPDDLSYLSSTEKNTLGIEIHSGRNRIVRRIFEHFGYTVKKLDRVYFAGLTKKNLPRGKWRHLTEKEVSILKRGAYE